MKNMKLRSISRVLLASGLTFCLIAPSLQAAPAKPAAKAPKAGQKQGRMKQIIKQLGLSAAQTAKIEAIWKKSQADLKTLHGNKTFTPDQKKARHQVIVADRMAAVRNVLTSAQRQKLEAMMGALKKQRALQHKGQNRKS